MAHASGVRTRRRKYSSIVRAVDPNLRADVRKTEEYRFGSGENQRVFVGNPATRGVYSEDN